MNIWEHLFAVFFQEVFAVPKTSTYGHHERKDYVNLCNLKVCSDSVQIYLENLDVKKGAGPDIIPNSFLKKFSKELAGILTIIFNESLTAGVFPKYWKLSHVVPIHKDGDKADIANYRGISIISAIPMLFEKMVFDRICVEVYPFISSFQHGFYPEKSITTNLVSFIHPTINWLELGIQVDVIHTDFKKAFDRVNQRLLIERLREFGFDGPLLSWFESYLMQRFQFVKFQNCTSGIYMVSSGVPQGSHLGPLFFIIFLNFVVAVLITVYFLIYADDMKLFYPVRSIEDCRTMQSALDCFSSWCLENDLALNVDKCKIISFTRKRTLLRYDYNISNTVLMRCEVVKDLGIYLDSRLTMEVHYDHVIARARRALGFIKRFSKEFDDIHVLKTLYFSYVRPITEFGSIIWSPHFKVHSDRLEAVQRNFSRYALRVLPWRDPSNIPQYEIRLRLLEMETLSHRRTSAEVMFISDLLSGRINCPSLLSDISINANSYSFRKTAFAKVPGHRTCYGFNNPFDRALRSFNDFYVNYDFDYSRFTIKKKLRNVGLFGQSLLT